MAVESGDDSGSAELGSYPVQIRFREPVLVDLQAPVWVRVNASQRQFHICLGQRVRVWLNPVKGGQRWSTVVRFGVGVGFGVRERFRDWLNRSNRVNPVKPGQLSESTRLTQSNHSAFQQGKWNIVEFTLASLVLETTSRSPN
ncbi:hypothetical protein Hdeb2414_s0004g00145081 [Helianthus debilis subsp. tardiflorus]